jgi:type VI secretion system protein ImpL
MSSKKKLGYITVIGTMTAAVAIAAYFKGTDLEPSAMHRVIFVLMIGAFLLLLKGPVAGAWGMIARRAPERVRHQREPAARIGKDQAPEVDLPALHGADLKFALRQRHGLFWRYRQPWLLLTGDDDAICSLLPELAERGWLITADAVLLWNRTDAHGQPDTAWLKKIYKLRRRRPVDGVLLAINGDDVLPAQHRHTSPIGLHLACIADILRWSAPIRVLDLAGKNLLHSDAMADAMPIVGGEFSSKADRAAIEATLRTIRDRLIPLSVVQLGVDPADTYAGELSQRLDKHGSDLAAWIVAVRNSRRHQRVHGAYFVQHSQSALTPAADLPLWRHLGDIARRQPGRRVGWHPVTVFSCIALIVLGIWSTGMLASAILNTRDVQALQQFVQQVRHAPDIAGRLRALLALQQGIERYEVRTAGYTPLLSRFGLNFGLNRDQEILAALWPSYAKASQGALVAPVQQALETELVDLTQLPRDPEGEPDDGLVQSGHEALKTYLMLAEPKRAEAAFLAPQLRRNWQPDTTLPSGEQRDLSERLLGFYASHLSAHPEWRIEASPDLINATRNTLLTVVGIRHAGSTLYRRLMDAAANRYPDQTLASLAAGTDPRGLIRNDAVIAGIYTRQAYDGTIAAAIADAAKRNRIASDWVLQDDAAQPEGRRGQAEQEDRQPPSSSPEALQAALTEQYFADYAEQWQRFMNGMQWQAAPGMRDAIEQLKLLADARQSPVLALMKSLRYQGAAGARQASLSDTLVARAQNLIGPKTDDLPRSRPDPSGPLGASFGPLLRLIGNSVGNNTDGGSNYGSNYGAGSEVSLQRYLDRISALRLKLQQINSSADAEARATQLALSLFQGKGSELADTQAYAQLVAASLGEQWAGMGDALFVRPVAQAGQTLLAPAQASLNDAWRSHIATAWNRAFAGRYPFARTDNDASLPELARFLKPQGGMIEGFLRTQLAGVLALQGDQWTPTAGSKLTFDPDFLKALNVLQRISGHLLTEGEARYRFELKPIPTAGVTDTLLTIDGQKLHYYNQRETWRGVVWPADQPQDAGTRLEWQTEQAGTNKRYEIDGRWALIRMLESARVEPIDSAVFQLTWQARPDTAAPEAVAKPSAAGVAVSAAADVANDLDSLTARAPLSPAPADIEWPLTWLMRTDVGRGPLELLALRNFVLPSRIFSSRAVGADGANSLKQETQPS